MMAYNEMFLTTERIRPAVLEGTLSLTSFNMHGTATSKTYLQTCATSEDSDQPVHLRNLIIIFSLCAFKIAKEAKFFYGDNEDWSDYADAHTNLCIGCAHMSEGMFSNVAVQFEMLLVTRCT